jgi:hypothetical protein
VDELLEWVAKLGRRAGGEVLEEGAEKGAKELAEEVVEEMTEEAAELVAKYGDEGAEVLPFLGKQMDDIDLDSLPDAYHYYYRDGQLVIARKPGVGGTYPHLSVGPDGSIVADAGRVSNRISKPGKMRKVLGTGPNHEAHHLIPDAVARDDPLTQMARERGIWDIDRKPNGISLPSNAEGLAGTPDLPLHSGSHPRWNDRAQTILKDARTDLIAEYGDISAVPDDVLAETLESVENQLRSDITTIGDKLK